MNDQSLLYAYVLNSQGGGKKIDKDEIDQWKPDDGILWIHFDYSHENTEKWLHENSGLNELVISALLSEQTRPRSTMIKNGLLLMLRGLNFNPGSDPEDMVSIRIWIDENRIISTNRRNLLSLDDMVASIEEDNGPASPSQFLSDLTNKITDRMSDLVNDIEDKADELEDLLLNEHNLYLRTKLAELRREAIGLRRYLIPQREALSRLFNEKLSWLTDTDRYQLHEASDRTMRYIENLDAVREKAIVLQEELMSQLSEQMNNRMYILSMIAAIFLPLGFFTGLLGINVGGIPGADKVHAFWIFCFILVLIVLIQVVLFKKMKWL